MAYMSLYGELYNRLLRRVLIWLSRRGKVVSKQTILLDNVIQYFAYKTEPWDECDPQEIFKMLKSVSPPHVYNMN